MYAWTKHTPNSKAKYAIPKAKQRKKDPLAIKPKIMCPVLKLAVKRTAKVRGRTHKDTLSMITSIGVKPKGAPLGVK